MAFEVHYRHDIASFLVDRLVPIVPQSDYIRRNSQLIYWKIFVRKYHRSYLFLYFINCEASISCISAAVGSWAVMSVMSIKTKSIKLSVCFVVVLDQIKCLSPSPTAHRTTTTFWLIFDLWSSRQPSNQQLSFSLTLQSSFFKITLDF